MKRFIVAGGTSGIGYELVKLLSINNKVIVLARNEREVSKLDNVSFIMVDFADSNNNLPIIDEPIDGLIYTPGTINLKPFKSFKFEEINADMQINFFGAVKFIQAYLPQLQKSNSGSIVFFSTVAVQTGMSFHSSTAAAKGAIEGLTRSLAAELAPKIKVNCIAPSLTNTPLAEKLISNEIRLKAAEERHPLKRIATAYEIAKSAAWLLDEDNTWMTGQIIKIDGGISTIR
jgi:3-oxoacyl-[acyl-carrier protein] reductase